MSVVSVRGFSGDGIFSNSLTNTQALGNEWTIAYWIKTTDNSSNAHSCGIYFGTDYYVAFIHNWAGSANPDALTLYIDTSGGAAWYIGMETTTFYDGNWHSLIGTRNGATINLYVDGVAITQDYSSGSPVTTSVTFPHGFALLNNDNVAAHPARGGGVACDGSVAEFAVWDRELTAGERGAVAKASPLFVMNGLTRYMPLTDMGDDQNIPELITGDDYFLASNTPGDVVFAADHPPIIHPTAQIIPFPPAAAAGGRTVEATTATMSAADYSATINLKRELASTLATMGMASYAAVVASGRSISANLATMIMADGAADVITNRDVLGTLGTMEAAAQVFTLTNDMNVSAALATIEATGNAADVNLKRQVAATLATLEGATAAADVERKRVIECTVALMAIQALKCSSIEGPIPPPQNALRRALIGMVGRGATRRRGL